MADYLDMYPAQQFSPPTELLSDVGETDTVIPIVDPSALPSGPNKAVIGEDDGAEIILYAEKKENEITGCVRGTEGTSARVWPKGSAIARCFTAGDHDAFLENIRRLTLTKADRASSPTDGHVLVAKENGDPRDSGTALDDITGGLISDDERQKLSALAQADWNASEGGAQILNKPQSLPANGGNADTLQEHPATDFVLAESGKGLSANDYTTPEKQKLAGLAQPDWNATSGSAVILNRPDVVIVPCSDTYDGTANVFRLTKDCPSQPLGNKFTVLFVPSHDYVTGATFLLDGESYEAVYNDGSTGVVDGAFKAGLCISLDFQKMDGGGVTKRSIAIFNNGLSRDSLLLGGHPPEYYLSNPNLLINGDFQVWQRGDGPFKTSSYAADRWFHWTTNVPDSMVSHTSDGLLFHAVNTPAESNYNRFLQQGFVRNGAFAKSLLGQVVTLTVKLDGQIFSYSNTLSGWKAERVKPYLELFIFDSEKSDFNTGIVLYDTAEHTLNWIKLERNDLYTGFFPLPYDTELLHSQRYYQVHSRGDIPPQELSPPMRINPRITQRPDGLWAYDAEV